MQIRPLKSDNYLGKYINTYLKAAQLDYRLYSFKQHKHQQNQNTNSVWASKCETKSKLINK